jgi:TetR/AcrR family transcriptional repressor of nem operon
MRRTRQATAESREAIVATASRLFREKGFDGIGVADIMAAAGLTHGGFYRHFPSKEALVAEAVAHAFAEKTRQLEARHAADQSNAVRTYISDYLSQGHMAQAGIGCPIATVGSDVPRMGNSLTATFGEGIQALLERIEASLAGSPEEKRQISLRTLATLVGTVVLGRATGDHAFQMEVIEAVLRDSEIGSIMHSPR